MADFTVTISCGFCPTSHEQTIVVPDGWATRYSGTDVENGFCPAHSAAEPFVDAQCPGCVAGWGECPLWDGFAFDERKLTQEDMAQVERGVCPKRINGTLMVRNPGGVESINLSEQAPTEAGVAMAGAIKDYWANYPSKYHQGEHWSERGRESDHAD
jgi:hypothetical protein